MTPLDDAALLDALGVALAPAPVAPTSDEVATVRGLVTDRDDRGVVYLPLASRRRHPLRQVVTVAAAVVALVVGVGVVALATGSSVPRDLRAPARALGLPVDSPALADARTAMSDLRTALARPDDTRVAAARDVLLARLRGLGADDRAAIDSEAKTLLAQAAARLRPVEIGDATGTARPAPTTTSRPESEAPVTGASGGAEPDAESAPTLAPPAELAEPEPATTVTSEPGEHETEDGTEG